MRRLLISDSISSIGIDSDVLCKLNDKNISKIEDLWLLKRGDLKVIGLSDQEIKHVIIKLQLNGFDLNKKVYSKN